MLDIRVKEQEQSGGSSFSSEILTSVASFRIGDRMARMTIVGGLGGSRPNNDASP